MSHLPLIGQFPSLRHPRSRRSGLVAVAVLGSCAAVSFAVAPLAADADLPLQKLVTEQVPTDVQADELRAWRGQSLQLHRSGLTRAGDTVGTLLRRLDVADATAAVLLSADPAVRAALAADKGLVQVRSDGDGDLLELVVRYPAADESQSQTHYSQLTTRRGPGGWSSEVRTLPLTLETRTASLRVRTELQAAAIEAGLPAAVVTKVLSLCGGAGAECHFAKGDSVAVLYETPIAGGEAVPWNDGAGRVLAARFVTAGVVQQYTWFVGPDGRGGYFDGRGHGRETGFASSPVEYTQITSGFATRIDPILHRAMAHQGVDYSAPTGTPVHTVAPGVVEFAGRQSGYGNVVEVRHTSDRTTLYAHLSRIDVATGDRVEQGRTLGAVGATGWATGPHLHFEYRVAGVHQDPQLAARAAEAVLLSPSARSSFERTAKVARTVLDHAMSLAARRTTFE